MKDVLVSGGKEGKLREIELRGGPSRPQQGGEEEEISWK